MGMKREAIVQKVARWLVLWAMAWLFFLVCLRMYARNVMGTWAFDSAAYRAKLFLIEAERIEQAHLFLSSLAEQDDHRAVKKADLSALGHEQGLLDLDLRHHSF